MLLHRLGEAGHCEIFIFSGSLLFPKDFASVVALSRLSDSINKEAVNLALLGKLNLIAALDKCRNFSNAPDIVDLPSSRLKLPVLLKRSKVGRFLYSWL